MTTDPQAAALATARKFIEYDEGITEWYAGSIPRLAALILAEREAAVREAIASRLGVSLPELAGWLSVRDAEAREAERAACEQIARERAEQWRMPGPRGVISEARAQISDEIADAIAARKGTP